MGNIINNLLFLFFLFVLQHRQVQGIKAYLIAAEIQDISKEYFLEEGTFAYVDTDMEPACMISNITIIKTFPEETKASLTLYGYSMGEYRIPVGMEYKSSICKTFEEKLILNPALEAIGFTLEDCPPPPGTYVNPGYFPDLSHFPEAFPRNQYVVNLEIKVDDEIIMIIKVYVEVV